MKIIIKMPSFLGDTIMTLPAFELLKKSYPNALFTIVCSASSKDLFRDKNIDKIIIDNTKSSKQGRIKRTFSLIEKIKEEEYQLGVLFHNTFLSALIFKLSKIKKLIGYEKESRKILLDFWIKIDRSRHYVNHYANLVNQYLDNRYDTLPLMQLNYKSSTLIQKSEKPLVGFVLGGDNKGTRAYPKKMAIELFKLLSNNNQDIILLGDKEDNQNNKFYQEYLIKNDQTVINISGKTSVGEFIDAIASLDLLVTIDTSAMHISASTNTNFLVLVGKGSSSFDTVYPKVDFGDFIFQGQHFIQDYALIEAIQPIQVYNKIEEKIKNIKENNL